MVINPMLIFATLQFNMGRTKRKMHADATSAKVKEKNSP
jgi:hypothetical protein